jgi:hypothetical protein
MSCGNGRLFLGKSLMGKDVSIGPVNGYKQVPPCFTICLLLVSISLPEGDDEFSTLQTLTDMVTTTNAETQQVLSYCT